MSQLRILARWDERLWPLGGSGERIDHAALDALAANLDSELVSEFVPSIVEVHTFAFWALAVFYQAGNRVPSELDQALRERLTDVQSDMLVPKANEHGEDVFVRVLFNALYESTESLNTPCWRVLLQLAVADPQFIRAVSLYEDDVRYYLERGTPRTEPVYTAWVRRLRPPNPDNRSAPPGW